MGRFVWNAPAGWLFPGKQICLIRPSQREAVFGPTTSRAPSLRATQIPFFFPKNLDIKISNTNLSFAVPNKISQKLKKVFNGKKYRATLEVKELVSQNTKKAFKAEKVNK